MNDLPNQRVALTDKTEAWRQKSVDAIISMTNFGWMGTSANWRDDTHRYYDYYNGVVDDSDYTHVLKPYGKDRANMPGTLHNYPIIKPVVDLLLGEKVKRPKHYNVIVSNPDVLTLREEKVTEKVKENMMQHFALVMQALGSAQATPTEDGQPPPPPQQIADATRKNHRDHRAIAGQEALNYIAYETRVEAKFSQLFKDWLIAGLVFTHKTIQGGDLLYEGLNPLDVDYDKSPDVDFIEDGEWASVRKMVTPSDVVNAFWMELTEEQIDRVYNPRNTETSPLFRYDNQNTNFKADGGTRFVEVIRVYWKSLKKIGIVEYEDEWGITQERVLDEDEFSTATKDVKWYWIPEVWEGTRIDGDIYINLRPYPIQRTSLDNKAKCKLPINGRKYSDRNSPNISLVALGVPYQLTYNIYKYRMELAVAKAKGVIAQIDLSLIPDGWDMDKYLYYIDSTGIAFYQSATEGKDRPGNTHKQVLDLTVKAIQEYQILTGMIKEEYETLVGVTRQRQGQTSPYELKGTTEQSIIQSSHITEDLFARFEEFEQVDLQGLMDLSKVAYVNGKKGMYIMPDGTDAFFELDGLQHMESEYGVFVTGGAKEAGKMETLRNIATQAAMSGNASLSILAEIVQSESFIKVTEKIKKVEEAQAAASQAQQQAEQALEQAKIQQEEKKMQHLSSENQLDRQNKIEIALINAQPDPEQADNGEGREKLSLDERKRQDDKEIREKDLSIKEKARVDARQVADSQFQIDLMQLDRDKEQEANKLKMDSQAHAQKMQQLRESHALKLKQQKETKKK